MQYTKVYQNHHLAQKTYIKDSMPSSIVNQEVRALSLKFTKCRKMCFW